MILSWLDTICSTAARWLVLRCACFPSTSRHVSELTIGSCWFCPASHRSDCVSFVADHFFRGERAAWRSAFHFDQITRLHAIFKLVPHFGEAGLTHRTFQRIAHEFAFVRHRVALQIFLSR